MKNPNAPTGNRTRDLPTCRAVPQPTAPCTSQYMLCLVLTDASCTASDGSAGVCRKVSECPAAQDDIRYTRPPVPVLCRSELKDSIVCCSNTRKVQSMRLGELLRDAGDIGKKRNKTGNVRINVALRRVRVTIVAVQKQ